MKINNLVSQTNPEYKKILTLTNDELELIKEGLIVVFDAYKSASNNTDDRNNRNTFVKNTITVEKMLSVIERNKNGRTIQRNKINR